MKATIESEVIELPPVNGYRTFKLGTRRFLDSQGNEVTREQFAALNVWPDVTINETVVAL